MSNDERQLRYAIIGAGIAGVLAAVKLKETGRTDFTVYEKGDSVGGTWRENTYPGLHCDVPSHFYTFSFAPNPNWSRMFAPGPEIKAYIEYVVESYDVGPHFRFGDEVKSLTFVDGRWHLDTAAGHRDDVDVVIAATGVLHHPKHIAFEGLDTFEGASFHSARWDHSVDLAGKRVGVVGNGSTGVQITAAIVDDVEHLSLFQRTAQWIMPMPENTLYTDEELATFSSDPSSVQGMRDFLSDLLTETVANALIDVESAQMKDIERLCRKNLNRVKDPELREQLRPDYRAACKRLVLSRDFYDAIQRPNAELVTADIDRIEPKGVRTVDGTLHELDVLVLCTGFHTDRFLRPIEVTGPDGLTLDDAWAERPAAYLAITMPGFPNLFMLNGPNGPVGNFSLIEVAELQWGYIEGLLAELTGGACRRISPTVEALEDFEQARIEAAATTVWATGCDSWYLDAKGVPSVWPWSFTRFRAEMAAPNLDHYERT